VIERMRGDIDLDVMGGESRWRGLTTAFTLSYRGGTPGRWPRLLTGSSYLEENLNVRERQPLGTAAFLQTGLEGAETRLDEQQRRQSEFKTRYLGELPKQTASNLVVLERLNTRLRSERENQVAPEAKRGSFVPYAGDARLTSHTEARPPRVLKRTGEVLTGLGCG
jgi:hypothetical protein